MRSYVVNSYIFWVLDKLFETETGRSIAQLSSAAYTSYSGSRNSSGYTGAFLPRVILRTPGPEIHIDNPTHRTSTRHRKEHSNCRFCFASICQQCCLAIQWISRQLVLSIGTLKSNTHVLVGPKAPEHTI